LQDVDAVKDEVASDKVELQGHYRIAGTHLLCSRFLTPAWTELQNKNPRLTAEIYSLRSAEVVAAVARAEYDLGLCLNPQPHPNVEASPVYLGQMVVAVSKRHPLLKLDMTRRIGAISGYPACLPKAFSGVDNCETHPVFKKFGIAPDIRCAFDSYEVAIENLSASNAWALMPCWVVRSNRDRLASIFPPGWDAPVRAWALWPKNRHLTKPLSRLIDGVKARFKALPQ
jgi:DNA-binding transcriptional LysR family regulator